MSTPPAPKQRRSVGESEMGRERSLSTSALERSRRGSRRDSVLPLCMSRDQHAAAHNSPAASQTSLRNQRRRSSSFAGSNKTRSLAGAPLSPSPPPPVSVANGWGALLGRQEANQEIGRAVQMCSLYPTLRVAGTAFENSLNVAHRMSVDGFVLPSSSRRGTVTEVNNSSFSGIHAPQPELGDAAAPRMSTSVLLETSTVLREVVEESRSFFEAGAGGGYRRGSVLIAAPSTAADAVSRSIAIAGGAKMVQMACAMKRAAMWEVVVVTALAHRAMELKFRRDRLRRVLERHMLPTLLARKKASGSVLGTAVASPSRRGGGGGGGADAAVSNTAVTGQDAGAAPQGSYLRDHEPFFASLNNATLLQAIAETMTRHRFLPSEIIARAGQPSQRSMFFLISGKCEVTHERGESDADAADSTMPAAEPPHASGVAETTPTFRDGMQSSTAPRSRARGKERPLARGLKEVLLPGTSFGGIFCGSAAVFTGTYRALSQCIVWELRADDFEKIFRPFSDRVMLDTYKESMRAHSLAWLQQHYAVQKVFGSIPVYRKLASRKARYLGDFTPVVKVRGEPLFAQGDAADAVYCLMEGTVLRRCRGRRGAQAEEGVAQYLATNAFSSFRAMGRFLLLGEEPHILPGVQPYSCRVSSRVALLYKVSGERFVSALLDDPTLFAQLRDRLLRQRQASMVLHPSCLAYVPLLQRFPAEKRAELAQFATPRVVGRSASLCEPAQHLSELMLVVSGEVRDPRTYGHKPTRALRVPASSEPGEAGESGKDGAARQHGGSVAGKAGKAERRPRDSSTPAAQAAAPPTPQTAAAAADPSQAQHSAALHAQGSLNNKRISVAVKGLRDAGDGNDSDTEDDEEMTMTATDSFPVEWEFSLTESPAGALSATGGAGGGVGLSNSSFHSAHGAAGGAGGGPGHSSKAAAAALVYPDESEEINPPLPPQASRTFLYALAGSWEGLLLDKWPNGWETASTVALWAIPTHKLRLVYNSCSKAAQASILNGLRLAQRDDQRLPSIPHTKLPPMTAYTQRGEAVVAPSISAPSEPQSKASTRGVGRLRVPAKRQQQQQQQVGLLSPPAQRGHALSLPLAVPTDGAPFYSGADASGGAGLQSASEDPLGGAKGPQRTAKANESASSSANAAVVGAAGKGASPPHARQPQVTMLKGQPQNVEAPHAHAAAARAKPAAAVSAKAAVPHATVETGDAARSLALLRSMPGPSKEGGGRKLHSLAGAASPPPPAVTVDPAVKAAYDGVLEAADPLMLRIVRDPIVASDSSASSALKPSAKRAAALAGRSLPPLPDSPTTSSHSAPVSTGFAAATWPTQAPAQGRWFQAVPSYEPLPGTMRAADTLAAPPVFSPNSTVLASAGIGSSEVHGKTLEGHVAYYAASGSPSGAGTAWRGEPAAAAAAAPVVSAGVSPHPLPKRRAYAA